MSITFAELKEKLKEEDEVFLLELLDIDSDKLVDLCEDLIDSKQDKLREYYGEDDSSVDR